MSTSHTGGTHGAAGGHTDPAPGDTVAHDHGGQARSGSAAVADTPDTRAVSRRSVVAASVGNALEWYDFSVYAFFATFISATFFADDDPGSALIATFVVFGAGFIARPLGALVVGAYGDRRGRKAALTLTIACMGIGTLLLVVTPSAATIGIGAPILLLVARLLQGFSAGGEIGGAAAFLVEHAPAGRRARYAAWLQASMGISNLLSAIIGVTLTAAFDDSVLADWAWRIPFVFGLLIIPAGLYIRAALPETEVFEREVDPASGRGDVARGSFLAPMKRLFVHHTGEVLTGFAFSILWTTAVYAFVIYGPTYYRSKSAGLPFSSNDSFVASLVGNVVLVAGCVAAGFAADRVGIVRVVATSAIGLLILPLPLLMWLHAAPTMPVLLVVHTLLCALVAMMAGVAPSLMTRIFPPDVRSSGISLSYNVAAVFFAGFTPAIMSWAVVALTPLAPALWAGIGCVTTLAALPAIRRYVDARAHDA